MPAAVLDLIEYGGFVDKASGSIDMRSAAVPLEVITGTGNRSPRKLRPYLPQSCLNLAWYPTKGELPA
jgi:hypothetical protein